jgi:hypothetical protein
MVSAMPGRTVALDRHGALGAPHLAPSRLVRAPHATDRWTVCGRESDAHRSRSAMNVITGFRPFDARPT